jgi:Spy/CpxP family protein refolding chaperone
MKLKKTAAVLMVATGLAIVPVMAQQAERPPNGNRSHQFDRAKFGPRMLDRIATRLNLNEAQKAAALQSMQDAKKQAEPIVAQMKQNRQEMDVAVKANNLSGISAAAARHGQLTAQMSEIRAKGMANFYAQLTPEQRTQLDQLKTQRKGRWHRGVEPAVAQ